MTADLSKLTEKDLEALAKYYRLREQFTKRKRVDRIHNRLIASACVVAFGVWLWAIIAIAQQ